ncbi:hypothetical protein OTERR_04150 [Oryzomicrobium terrae]|uniref:Uncharacterized protein n=1 Tax=Oryzomicrobium terrae TaxID=1735038 RepID=A0A5C1E4Q0_9RHOO|nr:hypothetical protein OTERR_04150 [Oryzomicrobium terrae]
MVGLFFCRGSCGLLVLTPLEVGLGVQIYALGLAFCH